MVNKQTGNFLIDTGMQKQVATPVSGYKSIVPDNNTKIKGLAEQSEAPAEATIRTKEKFFQDMSTVQEREGVDDVKALELVKNYYTQKGYTVEGLDLTQEAKEEIKVEEEPEVDLPGLDIGVKAGEAISETAKKFKFQSEVDDNIIESGLKFMGNLPANTVQIAGDLISVFSDPIGTATSVKTLAKSGIETGLNKLTGKDFFTSEELRQVSESVGEEFNKLGDPGRIKELLVENPGDVLLTFVGGAGIAKNVAKSKGLTNLATKLEKVETALNPIKIQAEGLKLGKAGISKVKQSIFPEKSLDDIVLEISQGTEKSIPAVKESLSKLDTRNVKTYKELNKGIGEKISDLAKKQDELLPDAPNLNIDDLTTTKGQRTFNFVKNALDDLEEVGNKETDLDLLNKVDDFRSKKLLSEKDINDLARFYGSEFKTKSFDKLGNPKSSVSAARFENTRKGLKEKSRELLPDDTVKALDDELSKLFTTRELTEKMASNVVNLQKKISERGVFESISRGLGKAIDIASLGTARGFLTSFLPSNIGNKVLNSIALEANLSKNLKRLNKLIEKSDKMDEASFTKEVIDFIKDLVGEKALTIEAASIEQNLETK